MEKLEKNWDNIVYLVNKFHPSRGKVCGYPITAAGAEQACQKVRDSITGEKSRRYPNQGERRAGYGYCPSNFKRNMVWNAGKFFGKRRARLF